MRQCEKGLLLLCVYGIYFATKYIFRVRGSCNRRDAYHLQDHVGQNFRKSGHGLLRKNLVQSFLRPTWHHLNGDI